MLDIKHVVRHSFSFWSQQASAIRLSVLCTLLAMATPAFAGSISYNPGELSFKTTGQSMWGTGSAFQDNASNFYGTQWQNATATFGGIFGKVNPPKYGPTNPKWYVWKGCYSLTHSSFICGGQPSKKWGVIVPGTDTRTGAKVSLTSSGKLGLQFGYSINSGSVDAKVGFGAQATLPQTGVNKQQYFSLNTKSSLNAGSIATLSPEVQASLDAIAQLSGSVSAEGCIFLAGCVKGQTSLPSVNVDQPILSIDPNGLNVVPGALPPLSGNPADPRQPLATVPLLGTGLTLEGAVSPPAEPGFKLTGPGNVTIADSEPPGPAITADLATIGFKVPNVATTGGLNGNGTGISSSGSDSFLNAFVDVSGVATVAGLPTQLGVDLIDTGTNGVKISGKFYAIDVNAGPQLSVVQNFDIKPTLMVKLAFSRPVMLGGKGGPVSSWQGAWADLPSIALLGTTTFRPTFWLDAQLTNKMGLGLDLTSLMDLLKFQFTASVGGLDVLDTSPVSLNSILGLSNQLFTTPSLNFPIGDGSTFALGGFNQINAAPFTINTTNVSVPEPGTLSMFIGGLGGLLLLMAWQRRKYGQDHSTNRV